MSAAEKTEATGDVELEEEGEDEGESEVGEVVPPALLVGATAGVVRSYLERGPSLTPGELLELVSGVRSRLAGERAG